MKLKNNIEIALGSKLIASTPLGVGFGLQGLRGTLSDGREIAVKALPENSPAKGADQLAIEGFMLRQLGTQTNLPVPEVYYSDASILVMSWIPNDGGAINPNVERHAAELLAELHNQKFTSFGYDRDTFIGPLTQPNPHTKTWLTFFRDHRLLYMARKAHEQGALSARYLARIENFAERLPDYLTEPDHPSLIHGDLWTGNVLVNSGGGGDGGGGSYGRRRGSQIAGFVDPAIYSAHPEIELAFTTMFGTFGTAFFDAYEALRPLESGFHDTRLAIYNLYPSLVHVRLFGSSYLSPIDHVLKRHGF